MVFTFTNQTGNQVLKMFNYLYDINFKIVEI